MNIKNLFTLSCLLALLLTLSNQTIAITQPAVTPFHNNTLQYWYTNFGVIYYNKPLSYQIYVTNSTLCGDAEQAKI